MKMKQQCIPVGCVLTLAQHVWWPLLSVSSRGIPPLVHDQERGTHPPPGHTHPLDIPTPRHTHPINIPTPGRSLIQEISPPWKGHGTRDTHLPPNAFENITFLQLRLRAEKLNLRGRPLEPPLDPLISDEWSTRTLFYIKHSLPLARNIK